MFQNLVRALQRTACNCSAVEWNTFGLLSESIEKTNVIDKFGAVKKLPF